MTDIQAPDGTIARFPDGMSDADIAAVMQRHFPPADETQYRSPEESSEEPPRSLSQDLGAFTSNLPFADRAAALGRTFGNDQGYSQNLADVRQAGQAASEASPGFALAGQIAPAALFPGTAAGAAGIGALQGLSTSPDFSDPAATARNALASALMGGAIGKGGEWLGAGLGKLAPAAVDASVPTLETIGAMKNQAYKTADELGVAYQPEAFSGLVGKIKADATAANIDPDLHRGAASVIANMQRTADSGEPITLTQLDQKRQLVGRDASGTPADRFFGNQIRSNIDNFIANAGPDQMASGTGPEAAAAIQNARQLNTIYAKSEALHEQLEHAKDMAGKSGSGANIDNWMRTAMQRTQDAQGGWAPAEAAQLQAGIRGGTGQNLLRQVGRLAPTGLMGGLEALSGVGAGLAHGIPGAAIPGAIAGTGQVAKSAADYMTRANANNLMATIMRGGTAAPPKPPVNLSPLAAALAAYAPNMRR
jgi:hypothetical protein